MNKHQHIKVFIADDHPVVALGLKCLLSRNADIDVVGTALSSSELFSELPRSRPTVLILDLHMPGSDFYENIAWVKANAPWVKILAYSGYYTTDLVRSLLAVGVDGYVAKTARPNEILEAISTILNGETFVSPPADAKSDNNPATNHPELQDDFRKRLSLSKREQEVLVLISKGLSSLNIGKTLYISKHTVETHRKNILRKLDFNSSTELVRFAVQNGLV